MKYTTTSEIIHDIKVKMKQDNIKNKDLAERLGKSQNTINNILNDDSRNITFNYLKDICDALGYDIDIDIKKRQ